MTFEVAVPWLLGLVMASVRAVAWLTVAPPFATRAIPAPVKVIFAVAMSLPVAGRLSTQMTDTSVAALISSTVLQVFTGVALGFTTYLLFAAVQAAGDMIDLFGGFTLAAAYDPLSNNQSSVFGRFSNMLGLTLLFTLNGHLLVLRGFMSSYDAIPLDAAVKPEVLMRVLTDGLGTFFLAALQIAAPLIAVLFLVDVGLGLLTRIAPALNAFQLGFPAKILATLLLVGLSLPLLPTAVQHIVDLSVRATMAVISH